MNDTPLVSITDIGSPPPPVPHPGALFHWDGQRDVCCKERPHVLEAPTFPSSFQTNDQFFALRIPPYLATDEIGLITSRTLQKIVWEQEATLLTFALDPSLLSGIADKRLSQISGELVWTPCHDQADQADQPASFPPAVHPILLVHSVYEACPVRRIEIVPDLKGHDPLLQHMALVLQTTIAGEGMNARCYVETLVDALAVHFLRRFGSTGHSLNNGHAGLSLDKLRGTIAYIKAHLAQKLSLVTLAAVAKTSPAHFARLFKRATGLAPHQYVIQCRMEEAKRLLAETEEALSEVGLHVGCTDQSHFTALFHKYVGLTPKAYRDSIKS